MSNPTKEELIEYLHLIQNKYPDRNVTRALYRLEGKYSDHTFQKFFGTFEQYLIEAGLKETKYESDLLKSIQKKSDNDKYSDINKEKRSFEGKYKRQFNNDHVVSVIASDLHDLSCDEFYLECLFDTLNRIKPEHFVINGDLVENLEFGKYGKDFREFKIKERFDWIQKFFTKVREVIPDSEIDFIAGNHENNLIKHLVNQTPQTLALLSDFHGLTLSSLFGLDKFEINFISKNDLSVFNDKKNIQENDLLLYDTLYITHYPVKNVSLPTITGHHHKYICNSHYNPVFGSFQSIQLGCGHIRNAGFCNAKAWNNGFLIADIFVKSKRVQFTYIDCTNDICCIGGKYYYRNK